MCGTISCNGETAGTETIRLAQISDIQIGENYSMKQLQRVVKKIEKQQPDMILFTGDLFENYAVCGAEAEAEVTALLGRLQAPLGKYAVWGNRDYGGGAARAYRRILDKAGFELLCNSSVQITAAEGKQVLLCGLDDGLFGAPDDAQFPQQMDTFAYRILLLHEPDLAQRWVQSDFQLILAGHSHGGQVRAAFLGRFAHRSGRAVYQTFLYLKRRNGAAAIRQYRLGNLSFACSIWRCSGNCSF